jgi:Domain of unknown function (DUF4252)
MYKSICILFGLFFLISCENKPTLQKYFVKNTESDDFVSVDLAPSVINTENIKLTPDEKAALASFDKMNILAYKTDLTYTEKFDQEIKEVKTLLQEDSYKELMKVGSGSDGAAVYFVGDEAHIDEFVVLASKREKGFAIVRVLGNDMNPTYVLNMLQLLKKSDLQLEQLKPIQDIMKK